MVRTLLTEMRSKRELDSAYRAAMVLAEQVLSNVDPLGIAGGRDEYSSEAARILARTRSVRNVDDLAHVVTGVFDEMFWRGACSDKNALKIARQLATVVQRLHG